MKYLYFIASIILFIFALFYGIDKQAKINENKSRFYDCLNAGLPYNECSTIWD